MASASVCGVKHVTKNEERMEEYRDEGGIVSVQRKEKSGSCGIFYRENAPTPSGRGDLERVV